MRRIILLLIPLKNLMYFRYPLQGHSMQAHQCTFPIQFFATEMQMNFSSASLLKKVCNYNYSQYYKTFQRRKCDIMTFVNLLITPWKEKIIIKLLKLSYTLRYNLDKAQVQNPIYFIEEIKVQSVSCTLFHFRIVPFEKKLNSTR